MKRLYIYGGGSISRETIRLVNKINFKKKTWKIEGIITKTSNFKKTIEGIKLFSEKQVKIKPNSYAVCAISDPIVKAKISKNLKKKKIKIATLVCPDIHIYKDVKLGSGSIVLSGSQIGHTTTLGKNSLISFGVDIGHNLKIGENFTILPNSTVGGYVNIGKNVMIGSGVNILPKINIGNNSRIGIGSTIIKNVKSNITLIIDQKKMILPRKPIKI